MYEPDPSDLYLQLRDEGSFVARNDVRLMQWFYRLYTLLSTNAASPAFVATIASRIYSTRQESNKELVGFIDNFSALPEEQQVQYARQFCLYVLYCHNFLPAQDGFEGVYAQAASLAGRWLAER